MARFILAAAALLTVSGHLIAAQSSSATASVSAPEIPSWAASDPSGYESFSKALNQQFVSLRTDFGAKINTGTPISPGVLGLGLEAAQLVADMPSIPLGSLISDKDKEQCAPAVLLESINLPTQCVGSVYEYIISGGYCVIAGTKGPVTCKKPSIELITKGSFCNLATKTPFQVKDVECTTVDTFDGLTTRGTISGGDKTTYKLSEVLPESAAAPAGSSSGTSASAAASSSDSKPMKHQKRNKHHKSGDKAN